MTRNFPKVFFVIIAASISLVVPNQTYAAGEDFADIRNEISKRHEEAVKRLRDWIALPSIAAEDRN